LTQPIAPVWTSEFVNILKGFFSAKIFKINDFTFKILNTGNCQTVHIFNPPKKYIDLAASVGILGFAYDSPNDLYVFLDRLDECRIVFTNTVRQKKIYVNSSSAQIFNWNSDNNTADFSALTRGLANFQISVINEGEYNIFFNDENGIKSKQLLLSKNGNISFVYNHFGKITVNISKK